jgi:hypothetical protein
MAALKEATEEKMNEYQKLHCRFRKAHFAELGKYRKTWATIFSSRICLACLVKECTIFLPCRHGLCESCFRTCAGEKRSDIAVQLDIGSCPLCCQTWQKHFSAWFFPRNSYRIMSLDGGGIKGIVTVSSNPDFWDGTSYPIRVAVTTVESSTSQCRIFTNYNSGNHPKSRFYRHALEEDPTINVPILACDA